MVIWIMVIQMKFNILEIISYYYVNTLDIILNI